MERVDRFRRAGAVVMTGIVVVGAAWWAVVVFMNLGVEPVYNEDGTLRIDRFSRAKDILSLILPLLTAALGFWFGSQGTVKAEKQADKAEKQADQARKAVDAAHNREVALTSVAAHTSADSEKSILELAKEQFPDHFPETTD